MTRLKQDLAAAGEERRELLVSCLWDALCQKLADPHGQAKRHADLISCRFAMQGYIESLTTALKRVEGENEMLKKTQADNSSAFAMLDSNQSVKVLNEKIEIINTQQQQIAMLQKQLDHTKDDNGKLSRSLDMSQAEISSLKSQLLTPRVSDREGELASALQLVEHQRFQMSEKVRMLELDCNEHKQAAAGHQQALQSLMLERDEIAGRYARLEQMTSVGNGASPSANGVGGSDLKKSMQLSIQLEVAQKEARVAHTQLIKLRSELHALKESRGAAADEDEMPVMKKQARGSQRSAPPPAPLGDVEAGSKVKELQSALAVKEASLQELRQDLKAKDAEISVLRADDSHSESKQEAASLLGLVAQLREQSAQQQSQIDAMKLQLHEKQQRIEQQQGQLDEQKQEEEDEDMPVFITKQKAGAQRSAAPQVSGQAKKIVDLEDEVNDLKRRLSEASKSLEEKNRELSTLQGGGDERAQGLEQQIHDLQAQLAMCQHDLETKLAPPPEVKKEMVLNLDELQPLMPKVLPVSRRPPHPLRYFEAPTKVVGASSAGQGDKQDSPVGSPAKTSQQEMAEVRAEVDALRAKQSEVQKQVEQLQQRGKPAELPPMLDGRLTITVDGAKNLPKLDMFGHADPYITIQVMQQTEKTKKKKNEANPTFGETFEFPLQQVPTQHNITFTLMEWNASWKGNHTPVGTATVPLRDVAKNQIAQQVSVQMQAASKPGIVSGPNQQPSVMVYTARFVPNVPSIIELSPDDQAALDAKSHELVSIGQEISNAEFRLAALGGASPVRTNQAGPWQLRLGLIRARNLPKMDMGGAADPYVKFHIEGQKEQKSQTITNTLDPEWKEEFVFDVKDDKGEMVVTVWDWDRMSKDEIIGEVRLRLADLSGKTSTRSIDIMKPGTTRHVIGKGSEKSSITLSLSASNAVANANPMGGGSASAADPSVPLTVSLKLDAPFDETVGSPESRRIFEDSLKSELASALAIDKDRLVVLNLQRGSVIVDVNILPDIDIMSKKTPESLAMSIMHQVAMMHKSALGKLPTTSRVVGCTLQNRKGQLEAENAFLVQQNGSLTTALAQIEKIQKLQKSEKADRILFRWKNKGLTQCFQSWKFVVEKEALTRELKEQAGKEMDGVNRELLDTKAQLDKNNQHVKDQLDVLKQTRQLALEDVEKAQNEAKAAMDKAEEEKEAAQAAAREVAERQHELEARLRKKLTEMKLQGGGPRLKMMVRKAEKLPKVDTFGWIDAYLSMSLGEESHKTKIIKKNENPEWNEDFEFAVTDPTDVLKIALFDWEMTSSHRSVGEIMIKVSEVIQMKSLDKSFELKSSDGSILTGKKGDNSLLHMSLSYEEKSDAELEAMRRELEELERQKQAKDSDVADAEAAIENAKDVFRVKPPFKIKVNVKSLRHLPNMDTFGKCDGYVVVECGDQRQQTNKVKSNYDPDFNETFEFVVKKSSQSLSFTIMDWESSGNHEEIGSTKIQVGKVMAGTIEHELTLIGAKTQDVVKGKDKQETKLLFSLTVEPPARETHEAADSGTTDASAGAKFVPWRLKVKLDCAESLPKMDTFGKCDGYVQMSVAGERKTSKTIKNEYYPQWNEEFEFDVTDDNDEFIAKVWDWDLGCQDDEVGSVAIPLSHLRGKEEGIEMMRAVMKDSKPVYGHDKMPTKLSFYFWAMKIEGALANGGSGDMADEPQKPVHGNLAIIARRADGLPKMDSWTGKADPYLKINVDGMAQQTTCKPKTLDPVWDEKFDFRCVASKSVVEVELFDRETTGKDRTMGTISIPVRNLLSYDTETYALTGVLPNGHPCTGKVYLKLSFVEASRDASSEIHATEPGVWVRVNSVNNLPKMDMMGKCDPLVQVEIDGETKTTDKQDNCYDAVYAEPAFHFPESGSSSIVEVAVFDANTIKGNQLVGSCLVDVSSADDKGNLHGDFNVLDKDGSAVIGHSKKPCTVSLSVRANSLPDEDSGDESDEEAVDVWDIDVTALKFRNMPKMDVLGSCDAYIKFSIRNQERRTSDITGYHGEWDETVHWHSVEGRDCNLLIEVYDKDLADKDDLIGTRIIPLKKFIKREKDMRIDLSDPSGKRVKGKDNKTTEIFLRLKGTRSQTVGGLLGFYGIQSEAYRAALSSLETQLCAETWQMDVSLLGAERLPRKLRPFAELRYWLGRSRFL